jgi:hypothetical protein
MLPDVYGQPLAIRNFENKRLQIAALHLSSWNSLSNILVSQHREFAHVQ